MCYFHPSLGKMNPFWRSYFSDGLKPPTRQRPRTFGAKLCHSTGPKDFLKPQVILLMQEILHHLGCVKPCREWDTLHINRCRISSIKSMYIIINICTFLSGPQGFRNCNQSFSTPNDPTSWGYRLNPHWKQTTWRTEWWVLATSHIIIWPHETILPKFTMNFEPYKQKRS